MFYENHVTESEKPLNSTPSCKPDGPIALQPQRVSGKSAIQRVLNETLGFAYGILVPLCYMANTRTAALRGGQPT
jgi:hypothetical protein